MLRVGEAGADASEGLLAHVSCSVLGAGCWLPVPPDWRLPQGVPGSYVAMLCVGGGATYRIGTETHALRPGDLLLSPPGVAREGTHDPANPLHLYSIHFHARLYGVLDAPSVFRIPTALRVAPGRHARMVYAAQRIVAEIGRSEPGHVLAAEGACAELLALIWRQAAAQGDAGDAGATARRLTRLAPVFRIIESRYGESLTLGQLADALHLQPSYFSTLFKTAVGVPPLRYLARFRLDRARELLLTTDLPLDAIAHRTGHSEAAYLARVFRAAEGIPPGEYRRTKKSPIVP